jgi:hypothetical protein
MHFLAVYRNVVKKTVNIISGKKPFTFLFLKFVDDYMSEGKECNSTFECLSEFSTHGLNSQTHLP